MTCKDCLYNKNCKVLAGHKVADVNGCTAFEDKSKWVKIVRCKDCKYRPTGELPHQSCPMWDSGDDFLGALWKGVDDGFCHYAERRKDDAEIH